MPLGPYKRKRNFSKTPEPPGPAAARSNGKLHFVIQKHNASHLHYDFRLENHGVLRSWAVPKGPCTDPSVKRLAMQVEDHPLDYQDFEGIIPEGNYGAGTVMIWDKGEYFVEPGLSAAENDKKVTEDLANGHLNLYLNGKKLKGRFVLFKIRGRRGNEWMLVKKSDEYANAPVPDEEQSAVSGRTLSQIAQHKENIWKSHKSTGRKKTVLEPAGSDLAGTPKRPAPVRVRPMLATLVDAPFNRRDWIFEVKWDGYRILAHLCAGQIRLQSRNDIPYVQSFPKVAAELQGMGFDGILDGELVVVDERGVSNFQLLQNYLRAGEGRLVYYVFDVLYYNGRDLHALPLRRRRRILANVLRAGEYVRISEGVEEHGEAFFKAARNSGLEGVVAKNLDSRYEFGRRSASWLKIKAVRQQEAVIGGFTAGRGSRKHFGALILGIYRDGQLHYIGHTGGGFDGRLLKDLHGRLKPIITKSCPFAVKPRTNAPVTWVEPRLVCQVKFQEWTDTGQMRQPIFLGLRQDKEPAEVGRETPQPAKGPSAALAGRVQLTHLDKVFWPKEGYTKGDVIEYYQKISPYILPYLKGRPQSMRRQPDGIEDPGFFHKNITFRPPAWVKLVNVESDGHAKPMRCIVCQDKQTLAYMNNMGCIEINPWSSTYDKARHPDFLVLDFDPVEVNFPTVVDAVLEAHRILEAARMKSLCKTSGGRGMHVYVPLGKRYSSDQVKDFAHFLCMVINKELPGITSLERSPHKRRGLIYLDYLQNHYGATMAAPYSLRPKPGATVSTPLEWKEVRRGLDVRDFNIRSIFARLMKKGDLWKAVLGPAQNLAAALKILERLHGKSA